MPSTFGGWIKGAEVRSGSQPSISWDDSDETTREAPPVQSDVDAKRRGMVQFSNSNRMDTQSEDAGSGHRKMPQE
ncbi:hypothetical protein NLI96_g2364 [Meripilus lineatus]|uniref:Uncharacterized protein n=1 Tax=Meripilus lineatus TaxID=2056292 RepID=A0AAD5VDB3_9APHY|nr:hypothetical protein NLI96_g2364 [Physisporinus lineatus]